MLLRLLMLGIGAFATVLAGVACASDEVEEPQPVTASPTAGAAVPPLTATPSPTPTVTPSPPPTATPSPTPTATPEPTYQSGRLLSGYRPTTITEGIKDRELCDDDHGPTGDTGWGVGTRIVVMRTGTDECRGWVHVRHDSDTSRTTWVRNEYVASANPPVVKLGDWRRNSYTESYSDARVTRLLLAADRVRNDQRYGSDEATLIIRCGYRHKGLEFIVQWGDDFHAAGYRGGSGNYRIDDGASKWVGWNESTDNGAAFLSNP